MPQATSAVPRDGQHPLALRTPWYQCERLNIDRFHPGARAPYIQQYDTTDVAERVVADPRNSLTIPSERRLFQPSRCRFHAVVIEVFCDHEGLPRPNPADEFTVSFAVRRHRELGEQSWMVDGLGGQGWVDVDSDGHPLPDRPITPEEQLDLNDALTEVTVLMWRVPINSALCDAARTRSLWFGLVPTWSRDYGTPFDESIPVKGSVGQHQYDVDSTYEIVCRAMRPGPGRCPPDMYWSGPSDPYLLASLCDEATDAPAPETKPPDPLCSEGQQ
ncbi:hypothetical protein [Kribbella sp. CA-247076]|uniref:hypothetical protein n=1 Tax=Kribbella sp. CA-247076 TaxID=3239941 RepID=UPI003D91682E